MTNENIWNIDETGFWIKYEKIHWVISTYAKKPLLFINPDNQDYVTYIEIISGGECDISPMVILASINILEK